MKILITGANSYIGTSFEDWMKQYNGSVIDTVDTVDNKWKSYDFSKYDVVFHVAGIAHVSADPKLEELYYKVNRDLTIDIAKVAKENGVKQFIFMSSIIVYGDSSNINHKRIINKDTIPQPSNFYGNSKLQAEEGILSLDDETFNVVVIRPPMIFGKGSKGNYPKLSKMAQKLPIFPEVDNERSMLHIDNLCEFIHLMIKNEEHGIFYPQNKEYVSTSQLVKLIGDVHGKKIRLTKVFNPILKIMGTFVGQINKAFGNLVYEKSMSEYKEEYRVNNLVDSIKKTEYELKDLLILSDNSLQSVGGEQESTKIIINSMKKKYNIGVVQPGSIQNETNNVEYYSVTSSIRMKHLIKKPLSFIKYIFSVKKIIKKAKPKVVHTQGQVSFFIVALLRKTHMISGKCKLIHTERGLYVKYNNIIKRIFIFFMKELDILVTTTKFNSDSWKNALANKNFKLDFKIIENTAGQIFEEYDIRKEVTPKSGITIGFSGRYCDWKDWPLASEIIKRANSVLKEELRVSMAVGCLDEKSKKEAQDMFTELQGILGANFNGKINISIDEMNEFYYGIDIFILTSKKNTESFGRTLVEAMSRKTVVLVTDAGGAVEVVGNDERICDDVESFLNLICKFKNDKHLLNEEKIRNLNRVKEEYSLLNNINKHFLLYKNAISN